MRLSLCRDGIEIRLRQVTAVFMKKPRLSGALRDRLLADLRGITERDRKEQRCNREGEDEDVGEAFHQRLLKGGYLRGVPAGGTKPSGRRRVDLSPSLANRPNST